MLKNFLQKHLDRIDEHFVFMKSKLSPGEQEFYKNTKNIYIQSILYADDQNLRILITNAIVKLYTIIREFGESNGLILEVNL